MIVTDTSAWIEYFRATGSPAAVEVRRLLTDHADQVVMCEPIAMAILSGARDDDKFAMLEQLVNGLPSLAIDDAVDFRAAAAIYRSGRRGGRTIRSLNDCLIAALAIRRGARVIHRDADYDVIAAVTSLESTSFRA
jgi:predicted nucleic acid-binding protein